MELDLLSMVAGAVASKAGGDVAGAATAPVRAVGEHWKQQVLARLQRHQAKIEKRGGGSGEAPDSIRVKAGVEAALRDDEVAHEYLAGVVAGASDDRPTAILAMIGRLSSLDLRLHYLLYRELHRLVRRTGPLLDDIRDDWEVGAGYEMFLPLDPLTQAMRVGVGPAASRQLLASLRVLASEGLVARISHHRMTYNGPRPGFTLGEAASLSEHLGRTGGVPGAGLVVSPTVTGMGLMAWVFNADGTGDPASFISLTSVPALDGDADDLDAVLVSDLPGS